MSWSVSAGAVPQTPVQGIRDALNNAKDANLNQFTNDSGEASLEQFNFAVEVVVEAAKAHILAAASEDAKLNIGLSGHANPEHKLSNTAGSNVGESLYISITRSTA